LKHVIAPTNQLLPLRHPPYVTRTTNPPPCAFFPKPNAGSGSLTSHLEPPTSSLAPFCPTQQLGPPTPHLCALFSNHVPSHRDHEPHSSINRPANLTSGSMKPHPPQRDTYAFPDMLRLPPSSLNKQPMESTPPSSLNKQPMESTPPSSLDNDVIAAGRL